MHPLLREEGWELKRLLRPRLQATTTGKATLRKKKKVALSRILKLNKGEFLFLLIGAINSVHAGAVLPVYAWVMGEVASDTKRVNIWAIFGVAAIVSIAGQHVRVTRTIRERVFRAILRQEVAWFDSEENSTGVILSWLSLDSACVRGALGDKILVWSMTFTALGVGFAICATLQWKMMILAMVLTPLFIGANYEQTFMQGGRLSKKTDDVYARASGIALEAVSSIRTVARIW